MLHVFLVDTGIMLKFDMELAVESVGYLMEAVHQRVFISTNKQVLLSALGEPLSPSNRVASYASVGTETQPIYLFSKSTIESPIPPSPSINLGSVESLMNEVETCLKMKPKYETLVARAQLAAEFQRLAVEIGENCEILVGDQFLQKSGWRAVVLNLDQITSAFEQHVQVFEEYYEAFFTAKLQYSEMIQKFEHVLILLKKLPLLNCIMESEQPITLLQWISTHDEQSSIENMVRQVHEALNKCGEDALHGMVVEAHKVLDSVNNEGMKEIKGLNERLESLQQRLLQVKQLVQDQTDMAQGFQQNKMRAEHVGDASVLPDLCASHQKQLTVLRKNHIKIRDIRNLCARAKDELSTNLHARLRWVMFIEKSIFECDSRLMVYHESLKRIKKRLDIFEQVYEAPKMYILAVLEVLRRKSFSVQFLEWSRSVSESAINARTEELSKREMFTSVFGNHFVKNLLPGLDRQPMPFAEEPPPSCDEHLPDISVDDIRLLQEAAPDLMSELHLGDMESSLVIQTCLSQSSLTKFVDPRSNKTLEETVNFREKAQVDNNQLTMSVLHREISRGDVVDLSFPGNVQFQVGSASSQDDDVIDGATTFEAGSLRSLSKEKMLVGSSDSEALMFHSAELDFTCPSPGVSSPIIASPSSVRSSKSGKSSSGKSSSSPIAIKSSSSINNWRCSQSLSPQPVPPVARGDLFSLPNFERQTSRLSVTDDKNSSQNSCRSLSEAIRLVEINNKLATSSDLLKVTSKSIFELKQKLITTKGDVKSAIEFFNTNLITVKANFDRCLSGKNEKITLLENVISDMKSDHHTQIESLEHEIEEYTKEIETLNSSKEEISNKQKEEHQRQCRTIESLESKNNELSKLKKDDDCQISELQLENKRLRELYEQLQNDSTSKGAQYIQQIELLQHECSKRQENFEDLEKYKQKLSDELKDVAVQLETLRHENGALKTQVDEISESTQQSIDEHLSHVSSVTTQHKELKKKLAEKEQELSQVLMMKDSLETQKQTNFNVVFNKIKKDKDAQIKEMAAKIAAYEKDFQSHKNRNSSLNKEINVHKEAYSSLESEFIKLKESNKDLENRFHDQQKENEETLAELNRHIESLKEEKLRVMQELKTQYDDGLEKVKADLLASEVEKQRSLEHVGKSEHVAATKDSTSSSIEEGLDALEFDQLMEKIKILENENAKIKETLADKESKEKEKERAISASPKAQKVVRTTSKPVEKIALRDLDIGSVVLLCFDESTHHFVALTLTNERYFVHPESLKEIQPGGRGASDKRQWMFACITEKELCVAKKPNNKFNLPVNTYFSRIHVKLYDDSR